MSATQRDDEFDELHATPVGDAHFDLAGRYLGEFHILRRLGRGGMSEVYLAEQTSLHRQVAVKVLRPELLADPTLLRRFEQEAQAAAGLIHPNIVQIYAFGEHDGVHYIAQEYVQGTNLREYLNRRGIPELSAVQAIVRQVASALATAAEAGIVHRDIKPENILITSKGVVKVVDFGLAQLAESEHRVQLTQVGTTLGTPLYMSPEQINGEAVDHRSDIYSLGVTCYRMLTGRPPFRGGTSLTLAMQHLTQSPEPLSALRSDLPPAMCEIVHKMMARQPQDRYQGAGEIVAALRQLSKQIKETQREPEPASAAVAPAPRARLLDRFLDWSWRRHLAALVASALLVGTATAAIGWIMRPHDPLRAPASSSSTVPRMETAREQFDRASRVPTDEFGWRAVMQHFPGDTDYTPRAQAKLGVLLLKTDRRDEAKRVFEELAANARQDAQAGAAGTAGLAVLASLRRDYAESQRLIAYQLAELQKNSDQLDRELQFLLARADEENSKNLGANTQRQLHGLFDDD